ncbi:hypothetical protein Ga0466249_002473 [Sporomusaceae bacterium BoRhaA]|uniref:hypothetical protein n=1 Tax=Pelorhabdus rhamnosifermentans TaxID=2772457 RepID=UPI001C05FC01|nr:hypothetical protein [Pelorhabdus rhamnosifermentans]MBU2701359.1 hypothetical protein [Pelorhabdus rhamnosifermentans]
MMDMLADKINLEEFEKDYHDGKSYHRRAEQFAHKGHHFSLIFNIAAIALERYLVALCDLYGIMPQNHNYTCLMDTLEGIIDFPPALNEEIRSLDLIFGICSLENYHHGAPESSDSKRILSLCNEVRQLIDQIRISSIRAAFENNQGDL